MKQKKIIKIEPLTPVHIGTGEKLLPLDYKLVNVKSAGRIVQRYARFSSDLILQRIATDKVLMKEFEKITSSKDMNGVRDFFYKNFSSEDLLYTCKMTDRFLQTFNKNKAKSAMENAMEVNECFRSELSSYVTIPGSSLKGSIRTALVDMCRDLSNNFDFFKAKKNKSFEKELLEYKDAKDDPFRSIIISDCVFKNNKIQTVGTMHIVESDRYRISEKNKAQILAEVIDGSLMNANVKAEDFSIIIDEELQKQKHFAKRFTINDVIDECNRFYSYTFEDEYNTYYRNLSSENTELFSVLKNKIDQIQKSDNSFVIRVGRWSQFESVTLYDERHKMGKTRTLFDYNGQYLPMGWCKCTIENL